MFLRICITGSEITGGFRPVHLRGYTFQVWLPTPQHPSGEKKENKMYLSWVKSVKEVHTVKEANRLLEDGWKLLLVCGNVTFVLGNKD